MNWLTTGRFVGTHQWPFPQSHLNTRSQLACSFLTRSSLSCFLSSSISLLFNLMFSISKNTTRSMTTPKHCKDYYKITCLHLNDQQRTAYSTFRYAKAIAWLKQHSSRLSPWRKECWMNHQQQADWRCLDVMSSTKIIDTQSSKLCSDGTMPDREGILWHHNLVWFTRLQWWQLSNELLVYHELFLIKQFNASIRSFPQPQYVTL